MDSKEKLECKCKGYDACFDSTWYPMTDKTKCPVHSGYSAEELRERERLAALRRAAGDKA